MSKNTPANESAPHADLAAAPVGELREALETVRQAIKRSPGNAEQIALRLIHFGEAERAALAAAPVTGDRETAGVERDRVLAAIRSVPSSDTMCLSTRDVNALADAILATPPSGGGDHAGGGRCPGCDTPLARGREAQSRGLAGCCPDMPEASSFVQVDDDATHPRGTDTLAASPKAQGSNVGLREALEAAEERGDALMIDKAWLTHCLAFNVEPVVRQCVTGVVGLDEPTTETLVEHLTAQLHDAIRPQSLKDSLAASRTGQKGAGSFDDYPAEGTESEGHIYRDGAWWKLSAHPDKAQPTTPKEPRA